MATNVSSTVKAPRTGWGPLPCVKCGEMEASITLRLDDFAGEDACHCSSCDADFSLDDVQVCIERWSRVLSWLDIAATIQ